MCLTNKYRKLICEGVRDALKPALDELGISVDDIIIRKVERGTAISYNDVGFILEPGDSITKHLDEIKEYLRAGVKS